MSDAIAPPRRKRIFARIGLVRLFIFFFALTVVYAGGQVVLSELARRLPKDQTSAVLMGGAILASVVAISIYALLVGWLERRDIRELAIARGFPRLLGGLILAFAMLSLVYAVLWGLHAADFLGFAGYASALSLLAMAVFSGVGEELIIRGGVFRILEDMFGTAVALLLSGGLFGALHLINPHATWFSALAIALEAGILLGAAYAATRNLWFPIGIHIGWNFAEGGVFGAPISGSPGGQGIFNFLLHGPAYLTGGPFGPEGSAVALAVCLVVGMFFVRRTIRRGRWVRASFHMMLD
jgi:uncharacterized protein